MKEGYPNHVCNLCQSQLNVFHAFICKAKCVSTQFENMLHEFKQDIHIEADERVTSRERLSSTDVVYEMLADEEINEKCSEPIEMEFIINKSQLELVGDEDDDIPLNGDEGFYHCLYTKLHTKIQLHSNGCYCLQKNILLNTLNQSI